MLNLWYAFQSVFFFWIRRIIKCGNCNAPFTGAWSKGRNTKYAYYFCRNRCITKSIPVEKVDEGLSDVLYTVTPTEDSLKLFVGLLRKTYMKRVSISAKEKTTSRFGINKAKCFKTNFSRKESYGNIFRWNL